MHLQDENDGTKVLLRMVGPLLAVVWGGDKHFLYSFFGKCVSIRFGVLPYHNSSLKFEIKAKQFYAASQRVL